VNRRILVIGDVLLDTDIDGDVNRVTPDAPAPVVEIRSVRERAGGAGLAATLLSRPGIDVTLATGFADDEPAKRLTALLDQHVRAVSMVSTPGTRCKTRVRSAGQSLVRLDIDPGPSSADGAAMPSDAGLLAELLAQADAVLVSDYAGGVVEHPVVRSVLSRHLGDLPVVWDPHPRGGPPLPGVTVATPNRAEALHFGGPGDLPAVAAGLLDRWRCGAVAVTDGVGGVFVATSAGVAFTPVPHRYEGDACGAGDRFAGTVTAGLAAGSDPAAAVAAAVADTAGWLRAGGVGRRADEIAICDDLDDAAGLVCRTHASGGTVVATGGCFDVLHAGHVTSLQAARGLGDVLVVLVNSDASVRRLKGAGRPVHGIEDRVRVLRSLACVDAVAVFDEDDPSVLLRRLRPDIWAKGGDYEPAGLAEASAVAAWGGRVISLPFLDGRSTTRILSHQTTIRESEVS
jgi:rfaE bifunctional protein nucleotidyltransferase chain/domain/rfaE bifunctional protein kinase chain/domain